MARKAERSRVPTPAGVTNPEAPGPGFVKTYGKKYGEQAN